jgi:uncharacterized protein
MATRRSLLRRSTAALALVALAAGLSAPGCEHDEGAKRGSGPAPVTQPPPPPAVTAPDPTAPAVELAPAAGGEPVTVTVELARTEHQIRRGLMYRQHLPPRHGMLFLMPQEAVHSFWMVNTLIPLDMIFIGTDMSVVGVIENAEPLTSTSRTLGVPSRYVLEVNGGFSAQHGIGAGARVRFLNVDAAP